jgi:hypothetical protein
MGSWVAFARAHAGAWAVSMLMVIAVPGIAAAFDADARTILILSPEDSRHPFRHVTTDTIAAKLSDSISAEFMESSQAPDGPDEDVIASRRIPLELQDKVFEPFITSKTHGLGPGLAISRIILKAHGGSIWCKQNPSGGAVFAFSLPAAERRIAWAS